MLDARDTAVKASAGAVLSGIAIMEVSQSDPELQKFSKLENSKLSNKTDRTNNDITEDHGR
jgi:hypothetical protein